MRRARPLDVAIVGMGCRFPGAPDLVAFWENILRGRESISDVPPDRWPASDFLDPDSTDNDRVSSARGGYLDEPIPIDPSLVGAMPRAIDGGEPEQYLVLDAARSALKDAGLPDGVPDGRRVEVVIGRGNYFNRGNLTRLQHGRIVAQTLAVFRAIHPRLSAHAVDELRRDLQSSLPCFGPETIPGQLTNSTSGRLANRLDLRGANFVVDAASASSLVALDLGSRALAEGRADLAIVGGVYVQSDVDFPLVFSRLGALSRSGRCRPFATIADGLVPGEGVGVIVLKRMSDALRDGDRIYANVKAVGLASDGRGKGLASPSARGHALAMRRAYRRSGVDPATVGLIEGHGLGLPAADRAELKAICAVFPPCRDRALGAVSSLIGHAMPASGIAGIIKAALALFHRSLPMTPGADQPHPLLRGPASPCRTLTSLRPWIHGRSDHPRRASVNAFGFAGINAHAVLEEHSPSADGDGPGALATWDGEAILISSRDRAGLIRRLETIASALERRPDLALKDVAYTLGSEPIRGDVRLGLVVGSTSDLALKIRSLTTKIGDPSCMSIRDNRGTYFHVRPIENRKLAVIFPGEGSQYAGMLADLCLHFPGVRARMDIADRVAIESGLPEVPSRVLHGDGHDEAGLWEMASAVNVVLSSQLALFGLITDLGVLADGVVGHSSGEWLALAAAGAIRPDRSFEDAMGRLGVAFGSLESTGALPEARLLAVACGRDRVEVLARGLPIDVAMDNCPHQVVIAGPRDATAVLEARLRDDGILFEPLPFPRGYHTEAFSSVVGPIRSILEEQVTSAPSRPIYSCASAALMPGDRDAVVALAADQWSRPVRFRETIERMYDDGYRVFVDVGARGHLAGFVDDILRGLDAVSLATHMPRRSGITQINHFVATMFSLGFAPETRVLSQRRRPLTVDFDAPSPPASTLPALRLGFPEMRVSGELAERLRLAIASNSECDAQEPGQAPGRSIPAAVPFDRAAAIRASSAVSPETFPMPIDGDDAMIDYLRTMDQFLATQREVMSAYLDPYRDASPPPRIGPWAGDVQEIDARSLVSIYRLDALGDPVASEHTLGGRRVSEVDPSRLGLPVVPFAVMAEMLAQAAAILVPGRSLIAIRDVKAHRWIRYEDDPVALEIRATREPEDVVRVAIFNRGPIGAMKAAETPVVEGMVAFADRPLDPIPAAAFSLPNPRASRFTAESLYGEQWLFHGPALQAVTRVGEISEGGIEGSLRILPRGPLLRDPSEAASLLTDPIILDNFTHLLGCWGLDELADRGDVIFPLRMGELALYGDAPEDGSEVDCRIRITRLEHRRVGVDAEVVRADGTAWMRISGWEDWRFHWPGKYRDVMRRPEVELLADEVALEGVAADDARAAWLEPPADFGRPVWRDVIEQTQLSTEEKAAISSGPEACRSPRLFGRIAAQDAVRRLWRDQGRTDVFPADLSIANDASGKPILTSPADPSGIRMPLLSIAHIEGVAVALATTDTNARPGIDVEAIAARSVSFEEIAFSKGERNLLDLASRTGDRDEWVARFWCAKEAAAKSSGLGMIDGPSSVEIVGLGPKIGEMMVAYGPGLSDRFPTPVVVTSERRGDFAWAWTLGRGGQES